MGGIPPSEGIDDIVQGLSVSITKFQGSGYTALRLLLLHLWRGAGDPI